MIVYIEGTVSETYITQSIVPTLKASKFLPVAVDEQQLRPLILLPWPTQGTSASMDVTFVIVVDRLGARDHTAQGPLKHTTIWAEAMAFIGDAPNFTNAGLVNVVFMLHHTSKAARAAFEITSGISIGAYEDYLCLASIPSEHDTLGMTLFVRCAPPPSPHCPHPHIRSTTPLLHLHMHPSPPSPPSPQTSGRLSTRSRTPSICQSRR